MNLTLEPYLSQQQRWPASGRHILAQFDDQTIVVYQAYRSSIGQYAVRHQRFGGEFSFNRMSWIKPNFLWMMYRSGWGTKDGQEVILAIRLRRDAFDAILAQAVHSSYQPHTYNSENEWATLVRQSNVRLQWDPDHDPSGAKVERRAIQLGLRGSVLTDYAHTWIVSIEDISHFIAEQRPYTTRERGYQHLRIPREEVYPVQDEAVARRLGIAIPD